MSEVVSGAERALGSFKARTTAMAGAPKIAVDCLVRRNRHLFEIELASETEVRALARDFLPAGPFRGRLRHWRLIVIRDLRTKKASYHLLGTRGLDGSWVTSAVVAIATDRLLAQTQDATYELRTRGIGEPPVKMLFALVGALRSWGYDAVYDLDLVSELELAELAARNRDD
jgi:hypothetical protein